MNKFKVGKIYKARLRINNGKSIRKHDIVFKVIGFPIDINHTYKFTKKIIKFIKRILFIKEMPTKLDKRMHIQLIKPKNNEFYYRVSLVPYNYMWLNTGELSRVEELKNAELLYESNKR